MKLIDTNIQHLFGEMDIGRLYDPDSLVEQVSFRFQMEQALRRLSAAF